MDNRDAVFERNLLQRMRHDLPNVLGMIGLALDNHSQGNDCVRFLFQSHFANEKRDFESTWNKMQDDIGSGREQAQLITTMIDESLDIFGIELARDDDESAFHVDDARPRRNELRHWVRMTNDQ